MHLYTSTNYLCIYCGYASSYWLLTGERTLRMWAFIHTCNQRWKAFRSSWVNPLAWVCWELNMDACFVFHNSWRGMLKQWREHWCMVVWEVRGSNEQQASCKADAELFFPLQSPSEVEEGGIPFVSFLAEGNLSFSCGDHITKFVKKCCMGSRGYEKDELCCTKSQLR